MVSTMADFVYPACHLHTFYFRIAFSHPPPPLLPTQKKCELGIIPCQMVLVSAMVPQLVSVTSSPVQQYLLAIVEDYTATSVMSMGTNQGCAPIST